MNREGYEGIDDVLERGDRTALSPEAFEAKANNTGAFTILDFTQPVRICKVLFKFHQYRHRRQFCPWVET